MTERRQPSPSSGARDPDRSWWQASTSISGPAAVALGSSMEPLAEAGAVGAPIPSGFDTTGRLESGMHSCALAALSHRLAGVARVRDVMTTVAQWAPDVLQATRCQLDVLNRGQGVPAVPHATLGELSAGENRTGVHATTPTNGRTVAAPLHNTRGEVFAVLDVDWPCDVALSPDLIMNLEVVVEICSRVLQRAMDHEAQESLVQALQYEFLPPMPTVAGLELSACVLPASDQLPFGGDWYDVIRLGPNATAVVVGDMVGHDAPAAARMARVRGLLNTLIQLDPRPGTVFSRAFDLLRSVRDPFIGTAALFVIDTAADFLVFARAGHPPALLRTPDGDVVLLTGGHGPALGLPTGKISPGYLPFPAGSTLLAYTDGLIERRGQDLDAGIRRIVGLLRSSPSGSSPTADQILHRVLRAAGVLAHRQDDIAAVVIHRT